MLILALVAFTVVILTLNKLRRQHKKAGVKSWIVNQDLDGKSSQVYRNADLGLSCKPDVVERNKIIEYKSSNVKGKPRHGDVLYVAAQMLSTKKNEADLRYANNAFTFRRDNSDMQRAMQKVRSIMGQMRKALQRREAPRGTPTPGKCKACMFNRECSEAAKS